MGGIITRNFNLQKDFGRIVNLSEVSNVDLALVIYNEQQCNDTLKYGHDQTQPVPISLSKLADASQSELKN